MRSQITHGLERRGNSDGSLHGVMVALAEAQMAFGQCNLPTPRTLGIRVSAECWARRLSQCQVSQSLRARCLRSDRAMGRRSSARFRRPISFSLIKGLLTKV